MKQTPFYALHQSLGAKFVDFGGWSLPVQFTGIAAEHAAVRSRAGLFDVSHMGELEVRGPQALSALDAVVTNDLSVLVDGQACYTAMCYPDGGIVDDLVIYRFAQDHFLICCNASNCAKDFDWLSEQITTASLQNVSDQYAQLALQGIESPKILQKLTQTPLEGIYSYHFALGQVAGVQAIFSRTGYTGEDGFELYVPWDEWPRVWEAVMEASDGQLSPAGLGARDTLRLEMKFALYGNDIDATTTPLEAGLGWITKLNKKAFIGKEALAAQKAAGLKRRLVAFVMDGPAIPRHGYEIVDADGQAVGHVTSGTRSPSSNKSIGLAYVPEGQQAVGQKLNVRIRQRVETATIVKPPFVKTISSAPKKA